jgi:predicted negative regulator of RcsB-dependent stress response
MKIINLLPKHKQEELRYESLFHSVLIASGIAVAILLLGLLVQLGLRFYLNHQTSAIQKDIEQIKQVTNKQENNEIRIKIRTINAQMNDFKSLSASTPTWSSATRPVSWTGLSSCAKFSTTPAPSAAGFDSSDGRPRQAWL